MVKHRHVLVKSWCSRWWREGGRETDEGNRDRLNRGRLRRGVLAFSGTPSSMMAERLHRSGRLNVQSGHREMHNSSDSDGSCSSNAVRQHFGLKRLRVGTYRLGVFFLKNFQWNGLRLRWALNGHRVFKRSWKSKEINATSPRTLPG